MAKPIRPTRDDLRKTLTEALDEAEWTWLTPHAERQSIVVVSQDLELVVAGESIALDDTQLVQEWLATGKITKPTPAQIEAWAANPTKRFLTLIVQPYVLIQEKAH